MSQTSDNSRTFRIINLSENVKTSLAELKVVVTQHENINYVENSFFEEYKNLKV